MEPYRIKMVQALPMPTFGERLEALERAHYNVFFLPASRVMVDLLTDSGTGAMSDRQWAALMQGDESYAGAESYDRFEAAVQRFTGKREVIPVHQGRAAEKILAFSLLEPGDGVVSNTLFDTTRANFLCRGARVFDCPHPESRNLASAYPFKGDADLECMEAVLKTEPRIRMIVMTLTNNTAGGQPVSLTHLQAVREMADRYGVLLVIDAARIAENVFLARPHDPQLRGLSVAEGVRRYLALADVVTMSAKKDGLGNIGGFLATDREDLAETFRNLLVVFEGFPTYGGLTGRDLEALAVGLGEVVDEAYLAHRVGQVRELARALRDGGVPVLWPPGGHAVFVEASRWMDHIPREAFPGVTVTVGLYLVGGVRAVEVGRLMFEDLPYEWVRLAIPRRTYTRDHLEWVARTFERLHEARHRLKGMRVVHAPRLLRHFRAHLAPQGWEARDLEDVALEVSV